MRVRDDLSVDTERLSVPSFSALDRVESDLEEVLDDLTAFLHEEIDYRRGKSDAPPPDTKPSGG
jgi:hypothetical protein